MTEGGGQWDRVAWYGMTVFVLIIGIASSGCSGPSLHAAIEQPMTSARVVQRFLEQNPTDPEEKRPRRFRRAKLVINTFDPLHLYPEGMCRKLANNSMWLPEKPYEGEEDVSIYGELIIRGHNTALVIAISSDGFFVGGHWRELFYNKPLAKSIEKEIKDAMQDPDIARRIRASDDKWLWKALGTCAGEQQNVE